MGPANGTPASDSAADAPISEGTSASISGSSDSTMRHDLDFIEEAVGEQRADRAIDEARGERLFFRGPAFTLEEATGDAARGVGLLDVVDGQREEVLAGDRFLGGHGGDEDDGVAHRDDDRGAGLAGDFAGFDGD